MKLRFSAWLNLYGKYILNSTKLLQLSSVPAFLYEAFLSAAVWPATNMTIAYKETIMLERILLIEYFIFELECSSKQ